MKSFHTKLTRNNSKGTLCVTKLNINAVNMYSRMQKAYQAEQEFKQQFQNMKLWDWQDITRHRTLNQNGRQVTWVVDRDGDNETTTLASYMFATDDAFLVRTRATRGSVTHAYKYQKVIVFDYTRDRGIRGKKKMNIDYYLMEKFKDGVIFSGNYHSKIKFISDAKVLVLANNAPDKTKLRADRWDILYLYGSKGDAKVSTVECKQECQGKQCVNPNCWCKHCLQRERPKKPQRQNIASEDKKELEKEEPKLDLGEYDIDLLFQDEPMVIDLTQEPTVIDLTNESKSKIKSKLDNVD